MSDQFAAMSALRKRPTLRDADLIVVGEASPDEVEWLDVKDGDIFCVMPIFMTSRKGDAWSPIVNAPVATP
jgi:hypothetical protein